MAPVVTWKYRLHFKLQYKPTENADKAARELRRNFIIFLEDWKKKHSNIFLLTWQLLVPTFMTEIN